MPFDPGRTLDTRPCSDQGLIQITDRQHQKECNELIRQISLPFEEITMSHNIGFIDQMLRLTIGTMLLAMVATDRAGPWAYIGLVPLITGLFRVCPLYSLLGVKTCGARY